MVEAKPWHHGTDFPQQTTWRIHDPQLSAPPASLELAQRVAHHGVA
jgi:hypothetical protein